MRISDWSSDVCSSDLADGLADLRVDFGDRRNAEKQGAQVKAGASGEDRDLARGMGLGDDVARFGRPARGKIGRASCRARVGQDVSISVVAVTLKQTTQKKR